MGMQALGGSADADLHPCLNLKLNVDGLSWTARNACIGGVCHTCEAAQGHAGFKLYEVSGWLSPGALTSMRAVDTTCLQRHAQSYTDSGTEPCHLVVRPAVL